MRGHLDLLAGSDQGTDAGLQTLVGGMPFRWGKAMTRRSSGFSTEGKCFIVLIRGKARIRHAGLITRVMLSSFSHPSQVMTSTLMSIVPGLAVAISITAPGAGFEVETPAVWRGEALAAERVDVGLQRPGDAVEGDQRRDQRAFAGPRVSDLKHSRGSGFGEPAGGSVGRSRTAQR
jgi:hypothetical protein